MNKEILRMQMLSGIITESEYKAKLEETKNPKSKKSLNENFVGIGAINNPFPEREKTDYELAFNHYMGNINEVEGEEEMDVEEMGEENPIDAITMDVPLFIRMLEFAREDASTDMDLHDLAEKAIAMSSEGEVLSMDKYEDLVGGEKEEMNEDFGDKTSKTLPKFKDYKEDHPEIYARMVSNFNPTGKNPFFPNLQLDMVDWKRTEEGEDFWEDVYDGRFEDAYNYIKYHGEKKGLDEYGRGKYDRKVGTYKGKYPIYQDDEGNNYIKTGSGIKDVEDLDQSQVKINK
jgi:hypothetical protein